MLASSPRSIQKAVKEYDIDIQSPVAERSGWTFAVNRLDVPLTDELQETARLLISSPASVLPATWTDPTFFYDKTYGKSRETMEQWLRA